MMPRFLLVCQIGVMLALHSFCSLGWAENWSEVAPQLHSQPLLVEPATELQQDTLFQTLPADLTGVDVINRLDWSHPQGLLFNTGFACGGIATGDIDGNGLPDLFFANGLGRNRLYLQQSPWRFVESSQKSGLNGEDGAPLGGDYWSTGATLFDIDNDGDLDLYVCNYDAPNALYINRGDGKFDERAADYGLDIVDACLMPAVADYDRDGDLDIYLAVNRYHEEKEFRRRDLFYWHDGMEYLRPAAKKHFAIRRHYGQAKQLNMWTGRRDRLLRNEGVGKKFTDVSDAMGLERGDTLSATWWDYDSDGWPDLYVCNDLAAPDRLFRNSQDGSFAEVTRKSLPHTPWLAMGSSAGDINNDGLADFLVADMSFRTHFKDKVFMGDMSDKFRNASSFPDTQLMRNALFVNTGTERFQEAAYLAGLASTDWTWTTKLADLDNDGLLDAFFTNGSPINLNGSSQLETTLIEAGAIDTRTLRKRYQSLPPVLEQNLAYQNRGDLRFVDQSQAWGLDHIGMSYAAVHVDIDRDGDLDLVVANLDQPPTLYRNDSKQPGVLIQLHGKQSNRFGIGAEVTLETDQGQQLRQVYPVAGFQSCQEPVIHFGLDTATKIRRLKVRWPSGAFQEFSNLDSGQFYVIEEPPGTARPAPERETLKPLFEELNNTIVAEHHEEPFDDFIRQPLLPNKLSQLGPPMAWGDVDGDGDEDLFLGEGSGWMGMLYLNQGDLQFTPRPQIAFARDAASEDSAATFLDANSDGHLDLYVASGSIECAAGDEVLQDRLYLGNGTGNFERASNAWLPDLRNSAGAIAANDFDQDGDLDLLVGTRSIPGEYPLAPPHAFLRNEGDRFVDALAEVAPGLADAGMITAAIWADINGDGWDDFIAATDWGPVRVYFNQEGKLVEQTVASGLDQWTGWWQSLASADVDADGDLDLIVGNFGLNTKYQASREKPVLIYHGEYGDSDRRNLIEASYEGDTLFPLRGKSCSSSAMPHLTRRFKTYESFAKATLSEIYTPDCLQRAERFEINTLASACFLNDGTGRFSMQPLPRAVQLAPVFAIAMTEVNDDGIPDLFCAQNFFGPQRETGPMDGGVGVVAIGRGDGTFEAMRPDDAGVVVAGDAKAAAAVDLDGDGWHDLCIATNNGPLKLFRHRGSRQSTQQVSAQAQPSSWLKKNTTLARQFIGSDQSEQSLPYLRRALKVAPRDTEALLLLLTVHRDQGRFADAKKILLRLRALDSVHPTRLLIEEGRLFLNMKQYDQAAESLQKALAASPTDRSVQRYLGEVRMKQGRLAEARWHFQAARRQDRLPDLEQRAEVARVLFEEAKRQRSTDEAEAIRLYQRSRRLDSRPATLNELAFLLETTTDSELRDAWLAEQLRTWAQQTPSVP